MLRLNCDCIDDLMILCIEWSTNVNKLIIYIETVDCLGTDLNGHFRDCTAQSVSFVSQK